MLASAAYSAGVPAVFMISVLQKTSSLFRFIVINMTSICNYFKLEWTDLFLMRLVLRLLTARLCGASQLQVLVICPSATLPCDRTVGWT